MQRIIELGIEAFNPETQEKLRDVMTENEFIQIPDEEPESYNDTLETICGIRLTYGDLDRDVLDMLGW